MADELTDIVSQAPEASASGEKRRLRMLIVEDEPDFLNLLGFYFSEQYDVCLEASTADAAKRIIERGEKYDILFVDYNNMRASKDESGGLTLYHKLLVAGKRPSVYILTSGFDWDKIENLGIADHVLRKPFKLTELNDTVFKIYMKRMENNSSENIPQVSETN